VNPPSVLNTVVLAEPVSRNRVMNALTSGCCEAGNAQWLWFPTCDKHSQHQSQAG